MFYGNIFLCSLKCVWKIGNTKLFPNQYGNCQSVCTKKWRQKMFPVIQGNKKNGCEIGSKNWFLHTNKIETANLCERQQRPTPSCWHGSRTSRCCHPHRLSRTRTTAARRQGDNDKEPSKVASEVVTQKRRRRQRPTLSRWCGSHASHQRCHCCPRKTTTTATSSTTTTMMGVTAPPPSLPLPTQGWCPRGRWGWGRITRSASWLRTVCVCHSKAVVATTTVPRQPSGVEEEAATLPPTCSSWCSPGPPPSSIATAVSKMKEEETMRATMPKTIKRCIYLAATIAVSVIVAEMENETHKNVPVKWMVTVGIVQ